MLCQGLAAGPFFADYFQLSQNHAMTTRYLLIKGKVQGVFFRASALEMAEKLGLVGWVQNTSEGYVEATITGTVEAVDAFTRWCWEGPSRAKVTSVEVREEATTPFSSFRILRG